MRTRKLIAPSLQLKLTSWFVCTVLAGLLLQYLLVTSQLSALAHELSSDPAKNMELVGSTSWRALRTSALVVLPLTVAVGVLATFRLVGPLHRLRDFLGRTVAGEKPEDCRLRRGDELQDFCELLNEATRPARAAGTDRAGLERAA